MTCLVMGATGATGRLLVRELLDRGQKVRAVARTPSRLGEAVLGHPKLSIVETSLLDLNQRDIQDLVSGCDSAASCLGHNLTFRGVFGQPRRLVTDATRRICATLRENPGDHPARFVLMNTAGNSNRDLDERVSVAQKAVLFLIRLLLPPHVDNEKASDHLRLEVGRADPRLEWVVVRPDKLLNEVDVSGYSLHPSPIRSAIFDAGVTSRVHVAHFMAELLTKAETWECWKGQMPVIYNASSSSG